MFTEYLIRLAVAASIGAVIGAEREFRDKAAGLRTIMLICIGSCLFTIMGQELITPDRGDPVRIASSIVSGVGFLGAGVIFRRGKHSTGITTAATIWCSAALGMASGGGKFDIAIAATVGILVVLWILPPLERFIDHQRESKRYELRTEVGSDAVERLHQLFDNASLQVIDCSHGKKNGHLVSEFDVIGKHESHTALSHELIATTWVLEYSS